MSQTGFPYETVEAIRDSVDCNLYFLDEKVSLDNMYVIVTAAIAVFIIIYIVMNVTILKKHDGMS